MAILPYRDELLASNNFIYYGDAVPSTGDFNVGDLLVITVTSAASPSGFYPAVYRCITASSSHNGGTWAAVGTGDFTGAAVATASSITPTGTVFHTTGNTTINTIAVPTGFVSGKAITIIPNTGFQITTSGNVAVAVSGVPNKALIMTYDGTNWYPSYT